MLHISELLICMMYMDDSSIVDMPVSCLLSGVSHSGVSRGGVSHSGVSRSLFHRDINYRNTKGMQIALNIKSNVVINI